MPAPRRPSFELYLITPTADPPQILATARAALRGIPPGRAALQLRAKHLPAAQLLTLARELRTLTRDQGVSLLINDRADVALAAQADGVQLPEQGLPPTAARALLGDTALIAVSCHDETGLARAAREGATFATLSPIFESPGKGPPLGLDRFSELARKAALPVFALGGIHPHHIPQLRSSGAAGVALISAVFDAPDPEAQALLCLAQTERHR